MEEDYILWSMYHQIGPRWSRIAKQIKGRSPNAVKNRFHGNIRKLSKIELRKQEIEQYKKVVEK